LRKDGLSQRIAS